MVVDVSATGSPDRVLRDASEFLRRDPVRHNLVLSVLRARVTHPEPGRYWFARINGEVAGVVLQSPTHFQATVTPMPDEAVRAAVDAIVEQGVELPGVNGQAATAARFAGSWSERARCTARPVHGQRIYEVDDVLEPVAVAGRMRPATASDHELLTAWFRAFASETGSAGDDPAVDVERRTAAGHLWVWDDGGAVAVAGARQPVEAVVRVGPVYTPPTRRARGYGSALVAAMSRAVRAAGDRCILYTDLGNATSNSIYRAIGYQVVEEALQYEFGAARPG
jgi:predicted GNAT family acetyltransferase